MFEQRTEAEMRLYSEKTARELALQRRRQESDAIPENSDAVENDGVSDPPTWDDEAQAPTPHPHNRPRDAATSPPA